MFRICALLIGLPATGKTTFRNQLLGYVASKQEESLPIWTSISTDDIVEQHAKSRGETYSECWPNYIDEAERITFAQLRYAADTGDDVIIIDRTHMNVKSRDKVIDLVDERRGGYIHIAFDFRCEEQEWLRRLGSRQGKVIPQHALDSMRKRYEPPTLQQFTLIENIDTTNGIPDIKKYHDLIQTLRRGLI